MFGVGSEPTLEHDGLPEQKPLLCLLTCGYEIHEAGKVDGVYEPALNCHWISKECFDLAARALQAGKWTPDDIRFSLAFQNLRWNEVPERQPHERTPSPWPDELLSGDGVHEFK